MVHVALGMASGNIIVVHIIYLQLNYKVTVLCIISDRIGGMPL